MFRSTSAGPAAPGHWLADGGVRRRLTVGVILAVLGGALLVLASPPVGLWPLVFVGFAPIAIAQNLVLPARWSGLALALGFGGFLGYAVGGALLPGQRWWFAPMVVMLWFSGRLTRAAHEATAFRHLWWADPVLWTAGLFVLALGPLGSWVDPAFALYRQPWLIQPVSVVAVAGLDLLILLVNYGLVTLCTAAPLRRRAVVAAGSVALLSVWTVVSLVELAGEHTGRSVRVAVVQPGLKHLVDPAGADARRRLASSTAARLVTATRRAAQDGAQLVVWPEATLRHVDPPAGDPDLTPVVAQTGVHLAFGYTPDPLRLNRAALLAPDGRYLLVYDKRHPVSFQGDHSIGGPVRVADTPFGRVGVVICYDIDYEETARAAARAGAQLLAVPSEDWSGIARWHYPRLVFRAVENRLAAAKADTAWDSAIVDPEGRLVAVDVSTRGEARLLVADVPLGTGRSPYVSVGDVVGWASVGLAGVWVAVGGRAFARRRLSPRSST